MQITCPFLFHSSNLTVTPCNPCGYHSHRLSLANLESPRSRYAPDEYDRSNDEVDVERSAAGSPGSPHLLRADEIALRRATQLKTQAGDREGEASAASETGE